MVAAGAGISLLPQLMLHPLRAGVVAKPVTEHTPLRRISAARRAARYRPAAADKFLALVAHAAREHAATSRG
ncbi:MAG: hypothetical protein JO321_01135 [Solirubrobacterales bacterium]|nr:hypothetical protein [Solirubrobacterales bacterium]